MVVSLRDLPPLYLRSDRDNRRWDHARPWFRPQATESSGDRHLTFGSHSKLTASFERRFHFDIFCVDQFSHQQADVTD
jgi:hypothetical protein